MELRSIWKSSHGLPLQTLPLLEVFATSPRVLLIGNSTKQGDGCNRHFDTATAALLAACNSRRGQ